MNQSDAYRNLANQRPFYKAKILLHTVHYLKVCASENRLGQTGQQTFGHLELFSDYVRGARRGIVDTQAVSAIAMVFISPASFNFFNLKALLNKISQPIWFFRDCCY